MLDAVLRSNPGVARCCDAGRPPHDHAFVTRQDQQVAAGAIVEDGAWLDRLQGELRGLLAPVFAQARSRLAAFAYIGALLAEHAWDWTAALAALQRFILARWVTRGRSWCWMRPRS